MFRLTCSLQFADTQVVNAEIVAATKNEDQPVAYSGPIERLPFCPKLANVIELQAYFASFARELGAGYCQHLDDDRVVLTPEIDRILERLKRLRARSRKQPGCLEHRK
jgi:hypothetical protein